MSNKIEIDVRINGKTAKLSDVSDETLANIKKSEVKSIEHGDYGYCGVLKNYRLFVRINGELNNYDERGCKCQSNVNNVLSKTLYTITGNVFKDMGSKT